MEFYQKILYLRVTHCTFIALQKFYSDHCLKYFCEFANNILFSFLLKKTNPHSLQQSSKHCASIVQRTNCNVAFWFGAIVRKGACTVISRLVAHSVDIVAWPVHRRFAFCTSWKVSEVNLFNDRGEIISNLGYLTSFPRNQKQQCRNCLH